MNSNRPAMQQQPAGDPLKFLWADRKLGAASKIAFFHLWQYAGGKPGRVVITANWLGGVCGRSPKAAALWLEELEKHDLVKLGEPNQCLGQRPCGYLQSVPRRDRRSSGNSDRSSDTAPDRQRRKHVGDRGRGRLARGRRFRRRNLRPLWYQRKQELNFAKVPRSQSSQRIQWIQ